MTNSKLKIALIADQWKWSAYNVVEGVSKYTKHIPTITCFRPPSDYETYDLIYYRYGALASRHIDMIRESTKKWVIGISGFGCLVRCCKPRMKEFSDFVYECDAMTVNNVQTKKTLDEIDSSIPVYVCHSGYDETLFKPSPFPDDFSIGWAGRVGGGKGYVPFTKLPYTQNPSAVGAQTGRKFYQMPNYYKTISVYVSTALLDGSPLPPKESAATGRPVVAITTGDLPEWMPSELLVENVGKESYKSLIPLIKELQNPTLMKEVGTQCYNAVQPYAYSKIYKEYDTMFESVMNE